MIARSLLSFCTSQLHSRQLHCFIMCWMMLNSNICRIQACWTSKHRAGSGKFPSSAQLLPAFQFPPEVTKNVLHKCQTYVVSAAILVSAQITHLPHDSSFHCHATVPDISSAANIDLRRTLESESMISDTSSAGTDSINNLKNVLSQPTADRPQIKPPTSTIMQSSNAKKPIIEGMVYMAEELKYDRPGPSDIFVLTVSSVSNPNEILAGAKYPVYKARLPFNFQLYEANVLRNKIEQYQTAEKKGEDFIVSIRVCPGDNSIGTGVFCNVENSSYKGKGVGKLLQIPGMQDGKTIRTPASLSLERNY